MSCLISIGKEPFRVKRIKQVQISDGLFETEIVAVGEPILCKPHDRITASDLPGLLGLPVYLKKIQKTKKLLKHVWIQVEVPTQKIK